MLLNCSDNEKLFAKSVPVSVKDVYTNQSRTNQLFLTIEWQDASAGMFSRKVLVISLTDNNDPFFLYNLHLSEEDFQMLKASQDLLINYASFPQHIIDYIEMCLLEERNPQPKFLLIFTINDKIGNVVSNSQLDIIETNQFKHLTHLSLKFVAATDSAVRQYLASCFRNLKEEKRQLQNRLAFLEQDLKDKLTACQNAITTKDQELERLRNETNDELKMKERKYALELQDERNRLLNKIKEEENRFEKERKDMQHNFRKQIQQLEARVSCLDTLNKELQDKNYKHESTIRELRTNLLSSEDEIRRLKENIHSCKRKHDSLHAELREKLSQISHQDEKINILEQELQNKGHNITRLKDQFDTDINQRKLLEAELKNVKLQLEMSEKSRRILDDEKLESNEIILKLQQKVKAGFEKAKSKSELSSMQGKKIEEQDKRIHELEKEIVELNITLHDKSSEVKAKDDSLSSLQKKIEYFEKEFKNKNNVIKWMNRHMTDHGIVPQYIPPANLIPSPSNIAQRQLQRISSGVQKSASPESSPVPSSVSNNTVPKSVRKVTPSGRKNSSTPAHLHRTDGTDSAYCTSPSSYTHVTPINRMENNPDFDPEELDIDPAALSAAFGSGDHIPKHSTAKKKPIPVKSTIPKMSKKR